MCSLKSFRFGTPHVQVYQVLDNFIVDGQIVETSVAAATLWTAEENYRQEEEAEEEHFAELDMLWGGD